MAIKWFQLVDSSQSGFSTMAIKWFQLVDVAGVAMTNVDGVAVDTAMVAMLQDAVKTKYADSHLTGIAPSDVVVFANRSDFSAKRAPLEFDDSIDALGEFPKDPLVVQVPPVHGPGFPAFSPLENADSFTSECGSLTTWEVGVVHDIPLIYELMKPLGGCTSNGKIFWRWEDQQLAALLLSGWFPESYPHVIKHLANKISIVVGSCGVGKSTLLCVLAFFVVLKHKKNVLVYRRLLDKGSENALLYLGWEQGRVVFISLPDCSDAWAANIYKSLRGTRNVVGHSARPRVDVWLDGFVYQHVPEGLPFVVLTTSQGVDLKSQDRDYVYRCLFPSWCRKDLFALGRAVFNFDDKEMEDRFY